ncbi:hypothetical protein Rhe02_26070 [Rhizocola hellebori]|uniref:Polysaccharide chain length determinant N-terminal domain-containing protein n=1 Tax=Rhizocola hellebori TaxID=1392758 RepID=A0A8J3VFH6_9ACTN|nr:polysaccharide biosynthesis tyrosine autokinase [Rhizocola hellebori]GIH04540.1 hypothetical protein Rhe02_26070 [Rhizocola hellebori]
MKRSGKERPWVGLAAAPRRAFRGWTQLTLAQHLRAVRRYRWLIASAALLGAIGAGAYSFLQPVSYRSSVEFLVAPNTADPDAAQLNHASNYVVQRVRTYRQIANSPEIASAVIAQLKLATEPSQLMSQITVSSTAGTAVLEVEVTDSSPQRAAAIANAIGLELPRMIDRVETPQGQSRSPVRVSVVRPAEVPTRPDSPQPVTDIAMGLLLGLAAGSLTGIVRYAGDPAVRDAQHASQLTQVPLAGMVPADAAAAELYRQIRANLRLLSAGSRLGSLTVAGAVPQRGGQSVAVHLALAFAVAGETVVVVDGDLRQPTIAGIFNIAAEVGLAEVLRGEIAITQAPVRCHEDLPLFAVPAGKGGSELLKQKELAAAIAALRATGAVVIFHAAPLLTDAESMILVHHTDATVLTAQVEVTPADQLSAAAEVLRQMEANLLGVIAIG